MKQDVYLVWFQYEHIHTHVPHAELLSIQPFPNPILVIGRRELDTIDRVMDVPSVERAIINQQRHNCHEQCNLGSHNPISVYS